jgi:hypothetical protein
MKTGVIFKSRAWIGGRHYRQGEYAQFSEDQARALTTAGTVEYADGRPAENRLVDREGHEIRAFETPVCPLPRRPAPRRPLARR